MTRSEVPVELLLIGGRRVPAKAGARAAVVNPATGERLAEVHVAGVEDAAAAVAAAREAYARGDWRRASSADRARVLLRLAELIRSKAAGLAALETRNVGKPIVDSRDEVELAARCFQYYAGLLPAFGGQTVPVAAKGHGFVFREPLGVVALIVPWNFPFAIASWKTAPALAAGNSVVLKPAEATPLTALALGELALEAGLPPGVLNVLPGEGAAAGAALVRHPDVRKVGFTGSTEVGAEVLRASADDIKRVSLELGGKSASLVFADADLSKAAASVFAVFGNAGQDCCARSRVLVERPVYREFVERFVERTRAIRVGDPMDDATEVGSLISRQHRETVDAYVTMGRQSGARLAIGGGPLTGGALDAGSFYQPTVFADVDPGAVIAREEIFGPVVSIMPFEGEAEAVRLANDSHYGLSGSLWTRDLARALRVARAVETGVLAVNTSHSVHLEMPFGGVKRSGVGRDLGVPALEQYTELKSVFVAED